MSGVRATYASCHRSAMGRVVIEIQAGTAEQQARAVAAAIHCAANAAARLPAQQRRAAAQSFDFFASDLLVDNGAFAAGTDLFVPPRAEAGRQDRRLSWASPVLIGLAVYGALMAIGRTLQALGVI